MMVILFLDTANPEHMASGFRAWQETYFSSRTVIVIDHHKSNSRYGNINIVDDKAASACELITEIVQELYPEEITEEIATYLFLWVSTDTGNFIYDKDSVRTFATAQRLLEKWARKKWIIDNMYRSNSPEQMQFIWTLITRITREQNVIYSRYTAEELSDLGLDKEAVEWFLPLMTSIKHDGIFALFKTNANDTQPYVRCSLRANVETQDVSEIATHFDGWWHKAAAWCKMMLDTDFQTTIQQAVKKMNILLSS